MGETREELGQENISGYFNMTHCSTVSKNIMWFALFYKKLIMKLNQHLVCLGLFMKFAKRYKVLKIMTTIRQQKLFRKGVKGKFLLKKLEEEKKFRKHQSS